VTRRAVTREATAAATGTIGNLLPFFTSSAMEAKKIRCIQHKLISKFGTSHVDLVNFFHDKVHAWQECVDG
jgi:hypothetical protein